MKYLSVNVLILATTHSATTRSALCASLQISIQA